MSEAVRTFRLDAGMVDGKPMGILKEDELSGNYNDYSPNGNALRIAALAVCSSCHLKELCKPQKVEAKGNKFLFFRNTELWIAGKEVDSPSCKLATDGVPQEEYGRVMRSWGNS